MESTTREALIEGLAFLDSTPSRARLRKMDDEELADVANRVGVAGVKAAVAASHLEGRLEALESELSDAGIVTNTPPNDPLAGLRRAEARVRNSKGLSFQVKSTLGCGPGDKSRFDEDRPLHDAQNEGGDGLGFKVRSTLGAGPGDKSRFD